MLAELGGVVPVRGLYVVDSRYDDPTAYDAWPAETKSTVRALLDARQEAVA